MKILSAPLQKKTASPCYTLLHCDMISQLTQPIPYEFLRARINQIQTSLVVQWLRIHLPRQGTQVRSLVWEVPTCRGATKSVHHNY